MKLKYAVAEYISIALLIITTIFTFLIISALPEKIPLHWNYLGFVDRTADKSWIFIGIVTSIIIYIILTIIFNYAKSKKVLIKNNVDSNRNYNHYRYANEYIGLTKFFIMLIPLLYTISVLLFYNANPFKIFIISSVLCLLLSLIFIVKAVQYLIRYQKGEQISFGNTLVKYLGYYDPENTHVFVDKKFGTGTTVNLATKGGKIFLIIMVCIPFAFIFGLVIYLIIK
jgi:uncharacterized membrane protein